MASKPYLNSEYRDQSFERFYYEVHSDENYENFKAFGVPSLPFMSADSTDEIFTIPPNMEFRPDTIAAMKWGRPDWDYVIYLINNLEGMLDLKSGTKIRLPAKSRVIGELF